MRPAIHVEQLSKQYRLGAGPRGGYRTLREAIVEGVRGPWSRLRRGRAAAAAPAESRDTLWALRDVSFAVRPGDVVGVIGRNGSGKSTLLKILSRVTEPTAGRVELRGRVGSLLEVGTGFHPELTGRENVYLSGAILGMSRAEIACKFDQIVAFSEIERFLDTPVKRYSSGMYVRLAFAVAAHLEPEILIVDEVLAVGDAEFQRKCVGRMGQVARDGRTVLFVSHNMSSVQHLCTRCVLLQKGKVALDGTPEQVIGAYHRLATGSGPAERALDGHPGRAPGGTPAMRHVAVRPCGPADVVSMGDDVEVTVTFDAPRPLADITFGVVVKNHLQVPVFGVNTLANPCPRPARPVRRGAITCRLDRLPLMPGPYFIDLYFGSGGVNFDVVLDAIQFEVHPRDVFGTGKLPPAFAGSIFWPATWHITADAPAAAPRTTGSPA
jgi:lipopolysaccharide transport system ATP-binding protein